MKKFPAIFFTDWNLLSVKGACDGLDISLIGLINSLLPPFKFFLYILLNDNDLYKFSVLCDLKYFLLYIKLLA